MVGTINGNKSSVNYGEMQALLADMMDRMNNRPIGLKSLTEHDIVPLTPNCLLIGRTSTRVGSYDDTEYLVEDYPKRLRYCQELLQFWRREFEKQVFFHLLPYQKYKDTKRFANLQVGDVCLLTYPGKIQETSRYCRVANVHPDEDGVVRNVTISLRSRNAREKLLMYKARKPMQMVVGVKRLVLICPNEEVHDSVNNDKSVVNMETQESVVNVNEIPENIEKNESVITEEVDVEVQKVVVTVVLDAEEILDLGSNVKKDKANMKAHLVQLMKYSK